jgi:hypothetical protein
LTKSEADFEDEVVNWAESRGGYALKLQIIGERGWGDRTIFLPERRLIIPELKKPGKNDGGSVNQRKWVRRLSELGFPTAFCESIDDVERLLWESYPSIKLDE